MTLEEALRNYPIMRDYVQVGRVEKKDGKYKFERPHYCTEEELQKILDEEVDVDVETDNITIYFDKDIKEVCKKIGRPYMVHEVYCAIFDPKKMHIYDVKTTGKHPVHLIEGGEYITEDDREFDPCGDMGWFFLNQREYEYFKSQCDWRIVD